jgi:hypothetical protein
MLLSPTTRYVLAYQLLDESKPRFKFLNDDQAESIKPFRDAFTYYWDYNREHKARKVFVDKAQFKGMYGWARHQTIYHFFVAIEVRRSDTREIAMLRSNDLAKLVKGLASECIKDSQRNYTLL